PLGARDFAIPRRRAEARREIRRQAASVFRWAERARLARQGEVRARRGAVEAGDRLPQAAARHAQALRGQGQAARAHRKAQSHRQARVRWAGRDRRALQQGPDSASSEEAPFAERRRARRAGGGRKGGEGGIVAWAFEPPRRQEEARTPRWSAPPWRFRFVGGGEIESVNPGAYDGGCIMCER